MADLAFTATDSPNKVCVTCLDCGASFDVGPQTARVMAVLAPTFDGCPAAAPGAAA